MKNDLSNYEILTVLRSQIKLYDKNPRSIADENRKRLRKGLKEFGLVTPLVWNKRTGCLVSGHQRLSIIDQENKYSDGRNDYEIQVAAIDVDEKTEARLVVFLNNGDTQGVFDESLLSSLFIDFDLDPEFEGFDRLSIPYEFDDRFKNHLDAGKGEPIETEVPQREEEPENEESEGEEVEEENDDAREEAIEKLKQAKKEGLERMQAAMDVDTFIVVACADKEQLNALKAKFDIPEWETYCTAEVVLSKLEEANEG